MKRTITKITTALFFTAVTCVSAQNLKVSELTQVTGGTYGDTNYSGKAMYVKKSPTNDEFSRNTWLKFDVSGYSNIASAILHISGNQTKDATFAPTAYEVTDDSWTQTTITWNNAPTPSTMIGAFPTTVISAANVYTDYALDVTSYVQAELAGDKLVSFFITDPSESNGQLRIVNTGSGNVPYLEISGTLGVEDKNMSKIATYPNPVRSGESLNLYSPVQIEKITVLGLDGRIIKNIENVKSNTYQLEVNHLFNNGMYIIQIENIEGAKSVQKIIKN